ncbi:hypothetical protein BDN67DRAFT_965237 [Paxillus ammoniavirescens]|nr:hypothetical protein BDN67DRAFT_965237 [Paxillus ammoniavirescens]
MIPKRHGERTRMLGVIVATCMTFGCDSRRPSCTSSTAVCRLLGTSSHLSTLTSESARTLFLPLLSHSVRRLK